MYGSERAENSFLGSKEEAVCIPSWSRGHCPHVAPHTQVVCAVEFAVFMVDVQ